MKGLATSFAADPDMPPSPSPVLIAVIVTFFVLSLLFGIGLFIYRRRKKRQAILLSSSNSSVRSVHSVRSSFGTDQFAHERDSTMVGLGGNGASMGLGGSPEMKEHDKSGTISADPFARSRHARFSGRSYSPSASSISFETSNIRIPPDDTPVMSKFGQWPIPGSYPAFANPPESSSEDHSSRLGRSAATHYEADTETFEPPSALSTRSIASPATTERTFHTAPHEQHRVPSPNRLSVIESISTPRKSGPESVDTS